MAKKSLALIFATLLIGMLFQVVYLLFLVAAAAFYRKGKNSQPVKKADKFVILIPAHNEVDTLPATLERFKALKIATNETVNPAQVVVIADNCSDATAEVARQAGVGLYERFDSERRGKGHALRWALEKLPQDFPEYEACVIFDADTVAADDFLLETAKAVQNGAQVVQGRYDVLKPEESWRTSLMYVAFVLFNHIRPLGRAALGFSDGLKGNGMVFRRSVLEQYPWEAYSLVEDIEYGTRLIEAGIKVTYLPQARLYGQAASTGKQALSQRLRWEGGRGKQARQDIPRLVRAGIRQRNFVPFDRAIDLVIPPLGLLFSLTAALGSLNAGAWLVVGGGWLGWTAALWTLPLGGIGLFVLGGLLVARVPARAYLALLFAPFYIVWKLWVYCLLLSRRQSQEWVRTPRSKIEAQDALQVSFDKN